jgi:exosortase
LQRRPLLLALGVLAAYWLLLIRGLGAQWSIYEQYSYAWSVPFLCAYLIWQRLQSSEFKVQASKFELAPSLPPRLFSATASEEAPPSDVQSSKFEVQSSKFEPAPSLAPRPSPFFYLLLALCALVYAPTRLVHEANPVWRLTSLLWTLEVIGLTLLIVRLAFSARRLAQVTFPICFFLVAVPWLYPVEVFLVESLTQLNVGATIELLGWFGIPAVQHANVIEIGTGMVGIDEACSGIRSFQATLMISLFLGELYRLSIARRGVCVLAGFAFAFIFNVGRTLLLTRIAASKGTGAIAAWHDPAGVTILVACFVSLWLLALGLRKMSAVRSSKFEVQGSKFNPASPGSPHASSALASEEAPPSGIQSSRFEVQGSKFDPGSPLPSSISQLRSPILALAAWLILVETGTELWYRVHERASDRRESWSVQLPAGYKIKEVQKLVTSEFHYDQGTAADWEDRNGAHWQLFYFRWDPAHSLARRVRVQRAKMHGPSTCLTHIGMTLNADLGATLIRIGEFRMAIQHYVFEVDGKPLHVFYGIYEDQTGSAVLANRRLGTASRIAAALAGSRNYGQRFLEIAVSGYDRPEDARAALTRELATLIKIEN